MDDDYDAHDIVQGVCGYLVVVGELVVSLGLEVANIFSFQQQHQSLGLAVCPAKDKKSAQENHHGIEKGKNVNHNKCRAKTNLDTIQLILHFVNFIIKSSISIFLAFPKLESL